MVSVTKLHWHIYGMPDIRAWHTTTGTGTARSAGTRRGSSSRLPAPTAGRSARSPSGPPRAVRSTAGTATGTTARPTAGRAGTSSETQAPQGAEKRHTQASESDAFFMRNKEGPRRGRGLTIRRSSCRLPCWRTGCRPRSRRRRTRRKEEGSSCRRRP